MYCTVNSLMCLWRFVIASEILIVKKRKKKLEKFLRQLTPDGLFKRKTWKLMCGFAKVIPKGDILPIRSQFGTAHDWQMATNHIHAVQEDAMWFSVPDIVASVLLTGRVPEVLDAFFIDARGKLPTLMSTKLRRVIGVDPKRQDFFRIIVEERLRVSSRAELTEVERKRLEKALKVLANATSYGIWAQMDRQEDDEKVETTCHGIDADPFTCKVAHPDVPGEFCFPPLASLITGGARLMVGLLEYCVSELGGTYVMEDTDSMAIVASEHGDLVPCFGGPFEMRDGRHAIKALSWQEVNEIAERFRQLSPYSDKSRSILKIERDNYDPTTVQQRQIYCLAISAKRYALFMRDEHGDPVLLQKGVNNHEDRWSEHGLGQLRNPYDFESEDRDWIREVWLYIIRMALRLPTEPLAFEPIPAVGRVMITSPKRMRSLAKLNRGKTHTERLKPFNFLLSCHVRPFGYPPGVDPEKFHLLALYEPNPNRWLKMAWVNQYTGEQYQITTKGFHGDPRTARVKTYGDVLREYAFHPGSKSVDIHGKPSGKQTIGLLQRRHMRVGQIIYIGKESNNLEEIIEGTIHSPQSVYTEYLDPRREEWPTKILPVLKRFPVTVLMRLSGKSRSMLIRTLTGRSRPRARNQVLLKSVLRKIGAL
jgi:hypothetical protein